MKLEVPLILVGLVGGMGSAPTGRTGATYEAGQGTHVSPLPPIVTVTAREYAFSGPDSIDSGPTTFRLVSAGHVQHFLGLVRIVSPHTFADYRRVLTVDPPPSWVIAAGGVGTISPGGVAMTTLNLQPGLYAMVCDIADAHGTPHMMKGMLRPLTVRPRGNGALMPKADVDIDLTEFAFSAPADIQAGLRVVEVRNVGSQPHMALVWRLLPGTSASAVIHWMDTPSDRSQPVALIGGVPPLAPGQEAQLLLDLDVGRYLLICLVDDDAHDHKAHYDKGMVKEFTVVPAVGR